MTVLIVSPPVGLGVYQSTRALLGVMLGHAQQLQAAITANSILSSLVLNLLNDCINVANFATQVGSNAALIASILNLYSADQQASGSQETPAQCGVLLNAMFTASSAVASAIAADLPKDTNGHLLLWTLVNDVPTPVTLAASQLPTTVTALPAFLATVS